MSKIVIFGGTVEGRELAEQLAEHGESVTVSVTSDYARSLLSEKVFCHVGALDKAEMFEFLLLNRPDKVIDCTHPFSVRVSENIKACCEELHIPLERVSRAQSEGEWKAYVEHVPNTHAAAQALKRTEGNVLLTTGSHTLSVYTNAIEPSRIWVRVLPMPEALSLCAEAGLEPAHIVAMQGPFSSALNAALYDQLFIRTIVTRDSGAQGGVAEKVIPALERDIHVILIDSPKEQNNAR